MASSIDAKLLRQTKFPPEFNRKVDMKKVNIEVMKKWIAGKISEILGNEDDVVIELCFNLLEGSRFPDIKSLQIQLTGFLDKDTAKFCKDLWSLCLSAQENPQGVPKELLEAKKLELIQEKIEAEKAAEEARRKKEQELARERELEEIRRRERFDRNRGRRGGGRGGRDFDRRPYRDNRSPPRRRSRERFRDPPSRREFDSYVPPGSRRGRRPSRSPSASRSRSRSVSSSRSPPRRRLPSRDRYRDKRRRSASGSVSPVRGDHRRPRRRSPDYEETKGDEDLSLPAVHPVRRLPETGAEGKTDPAPGQGLGREGRMRRAADGGDPHLTPQKLTRMNQPLILQRPASPVMIAV
ncbi:PWI domain-containing mRNA processing protein [Aspergillus lentulus]|uniref:PWI domain-containing protein n=1 Tax=Aspergillus lentulus TaxID=293939 RepID=UPI001393CED7|nr:PWI domain-containing mRNA processing protein [Aspergillus lentulus]GFF38579.1 PWI domain-containing mRNA processing protein [Aspergillus lentulus]GFF68769.1 PWI domain-containing mRNA processing protein [Aspergillus lentulus]GFG13454.1 PWI domain-containing mRNA processing protein [Aspergillus lentulus]